MSDAPGANYSRIDRILHRWAFAGIEIQKSLADIEDRVYAAHIGMAPVTAPVFITSLPRAGTTLLLDLVAKIPGFVTHTYRSMPFVMCPILWDSISRGFRRQAVERERAHGDGKTVSYDSPEAFEEILWKAFWPGKYHSNHIDLWSATDRDAEFEEFFFSHLRKLTALAPPSAAPRYLSKNNGNIARLPLLASIFPDAVCFVPFRDPVDQAGSLLRQHRRFVKIHADDAFARHYMEDIGHFEFGAGLKPFAFPALPGTALGSDPQGGDYWLEYWIRCYTYLLSSGGLLSSADAQVHFVDFDHMCETPLPAITAIAERLDGGKSLAPLRAEAGIFHPAVHYAAADIGFDAGLLERARALHGQLMQRAINFP